MVNSAEVRRAQLAKSTPSPPRWCPWDLFQILKVCLDAKGVQKATGSYCTHSIPDKTAALVPAVEDLPSAELQPRFLHLQ